MRGPCGRAWDVTNVSHMGVSDAVRAAWIVDVPDAHPFWSKYLVAVVDDEDQPPLIVGEHYELAVYPLDPSAHPIPEDYWSWLPMLPANVTVQFDAPRVEQAEKMCEFAVRMVLTGSLAVELQAPWQSMIRLAAKEVPDASV